MDKIDLNDYIVEIFQDLAEVESMLKILKSAVCNEYDEALKIDIENTLEILITKIANTKNSLDKYINTIF